MIGRARAVDCLGAERDLAPRITPFPTGRIMFAAFLGISCLAIIRLSLRDNIPTAP